MGHPAPFHLTMMGVGNEQWGPQYVERYKIFAKALHDRYPDIKLVSSVGPFAGGDLFNFLNPLMRELKADFLDEHYYMPPEFFLRNATRYDHYDRKGPKIFAGEYAAHVKNTDGIERNNWMSALSEAAFMTGLERNADVVHMCSYAPLFAHADAWQWAPDLIWFNSLYSYGTPNYYVQKMFATNRGTHLISVTEDGQPLTGQDSLYASAVWDETSGTTILKMVNASSSERRRLINTSSQKIKWKTADFEILKADSLAAINSLKSPHAIVPASGKLDWRKEKGMIRIPARSVMVLRVKG
jgi:alpha-L-arabinofuranosidase